MAKYKRRFSDRLEDRDPSVIRMDVGECYDAIIIPMDGGYLTHFPGCPAILRGPDILVQTHLLNFGEKIDWGQTVQSPTTAWTALHQEILRDPSLFEHFPLWARKFEEFVAGGYATANWNNVILTPRSNDGGFDVAACKRGRSILDEAKAYSSSNLVDHQIVRAALGLMVQYEGLLTIDQVRVTTTSWFAPTIGEQFSRLMPHVLALRDHDALLRWLVSMGPTL